MSSEHGQIVYCVLPVDNLVSDVTWMYELFKLDEPPVVRVTVRWIKIKSATNSTKGDFYD